MITHENIKMKSQFQKKLGELIKTFEEEGYEALSDSLGLNIVGIDQLLPPIESNLPYSEIEFSQHLLKIQLDQTTDQASRRMTMQRKIVNWIAKVSSFDENSRLLQPLCGPGITAKILNEYGLQHYLGVDISPAIISYANQLHRSNRGFSFLCQDVLNEKLSFSKDKFTIAFLGFEAMNAFSYQKTQNLLVKISKQLTKEGLLIAEIRMLSRLEKNNIKKYRVSSSGRQVITNKRANVFYSKPSIMFDEWGYSKDLSQYGHQICLLKLNDLKFHKIYRTFIYIYDPDTLTKLLTQSGFKLITCEKLPFSKKTDLEECQHNWFIVAKKI